MIGKRSIAAEAPLKYAEITGVVTVGEESARRLGVPVGTKVDLGTLAVTHKNPIRNWWAQRRIKPNVFN